MPSEISRHVAPNFTSVCRLLTLAFTILAFKNSTYLDETIDHIWRDVLQPSPYFRHDSFEVILSSLLFAFCTFCWFILDFYVPAAHTFRIVDSAGSNQSWKGRESALFQETLWYAVPWILFDAAVPRRHLLLAQSAEPPTFFRIVQDLVCTLITYDVLFFIGHMAMHRNRFLFRTVHSKHHTSGTRLTLLSSSIVQLLFNWKPIFSLTIMLYAGANIRAIDAIRHTALDGFFDVICSVLALKIVRAHPMSRSIFNVIAIYLISEAHSGYDFPWSVHNLTSLFAGPVLHRKHHHNGSCNFAKFFVWCDFFCGTLSY